MIRKPQIHPLAERHIRELRERWHIEPTLEECLWIVQLAERVLNPVAGTRMELAEIPERVGVSDEWLHPLTIGAALWFTERASAWWADDRERLFKAIAWAMSVDEWNDGWGVEKKRAVIKESRHIHQHKGTLSAIKRALAAIGQPDATVIERGNYMTGEYSHVVAALAANTVLVVVLRVGGVQQRLHIGLHGAQIVRVDA